jgi:hypothetical protein
VHCSHLGGVAFGEFVFQVLFRGWIYYCCYAWDTIAGLFFLSL